MTEQWHYRDLQESERLVKEQEFRSRLHEVVRQVAPVKARVDFHEENSPIAAAINEVIQSYPDDLPIDLLRLDYSGDINNTSAALNAKNTSEGFVQGFHRMINAFMNAGILNLGGAREFVNSAQQNNRSVLTQGATLTFFKQVLRK